MDPRQLEYVVGVVDHGGFTRAAAALHVTQPALSQGIARLEAELGILLFDRVGRTAVLTAAGEAMLEPARQVLRDLRVLRTSVAAVAGLDAGSLEVAALPTLAIDPLAGIIGAFRRAHPQVAVRAEQPEEVASVAARVRAGQVEVGLTELPVTGAGLVTEVLFEQEFVVVVPPSSPLASRRRVTITDLAGVPLVVLPHGTSTRRVIDEAFAEAGVEPEIAVETDEREAVIPLVLADAGISIVPTSLAAAPRGASLVRLSPPLRRSIGLVHRDGPLSPAAREFLAISRTAAA